MKKNEDLLLGAGHGYAESGFRATCKSDLKEVTNDTRSAMPAVRPDRFSESHLDDIVRYSADAERLRSER